MADNDYIGQIQNQRLNQQWSNSMNWSTPSWMRGGFKEGQKPSTQRFQVTTSGARLNWGQGDTEMRDGRSIDKKEEENQYEENSRPSFLSNLLTKRSSSRTSGRSEEYEGSM